MHRITAIVFGIVLLIILGLVTVRKIQYERDVSGHLKLAADANSTEFAERKLKLATDGMEAWDFCNDGGENCFTSVIYRTPEDDVGYWRENIESTLADLQSMSDAERADNLIESNQLMKVRETLLDSGPSGDHVTDPKGIFKYPNNTGFALWLTVALIGLGIGAFQWGRRDW